MDPRRLIVPVAALLPCLPAAAQDFCDIGPCGTGSCCEANGTRGCDDEACCVRVCFNFQSCCTTSWDQFCADHALSVCGACGGNDTNFACCMEDGTCMQMTIPDCFATGGCPGQSSNCFAVNCNFTGACCPPLNECTISHSSACSVTGGNFTAGLECSLDFCPVEACCLPDGSCVPAIPTSCAGQGGEPGGPGTTCGASTEPLCLEPVACCFLDGSCSNLLSVDCLLEGGSPQRVPCSEDPCPGAGACCGPFECIQITQGPCENNGGVWMGEGVACEPSPCPGACCLEFDGCLVMSEIECMVAGGAYRGIGSLCPDDCVGACCDGLACTVVLEPFCSSPGELFLGPGTTCDPSQCQGACCLPDGLCVITFPEECDGVFQGGGMPCDEVDCASLGGCCLADGSCADTDGMTCAKISGDFQGVGVFCATDPCPQPQACCFADGSCFDIQPLLCAAQAGVSLAGTCKAAACDQDTGCCNPGGGCLTMTASECAMFGGIPAGAPCDSAICPGAASWQACCPPDQLPCVFIPDTYCKELGGSALGPGATCKEPGCIAPGDINGDGFTDVLDLVLVILNWGFCAACPADVDLDGVVGILDLIFIVQHWNPPPPQ